MKDENEIEYLSEKNEYGSERKKRVPFLLILAVAALVLSLVNWFQIIMRLINESYQNSKQEFLITGIVSGAIFVLFFILFLTIRTTEKKDFISKKDDPANDNPSRNVEVTDGFVDLSSDDIYLQAEDEEEASNKKEEVEEVDTFNLTTSIISERLLNAFHRNSLHCDSAYLTGALAATNLLFVDKNSQDESHILNSIAQGFAGKDFLVDAQGYSTCNDLIATKGFLSFIDESNSDLGKLFFVGIKNVNYNSIKEILDDFLEALFDRNNSSRVDLNVNGGTETHFLSQNIFFIVFCNSDDKVLSLPANILKYSLNINLSIKSSPSENTDLDVTPISYYDFRRAVNYCLQTDFMSENRWTKIDELADFLNNKKPYMVSNDVLNNIEAFSGVLLSLGTKKDVVFDRVCADILLPSILKDFGREHIVGDGGIYHYVNDNFANVYTMPKTEALIKDARYLNNDKEEKKASKNLFEEFEETLNESLKEKNSAISKEKDK